MTAPTPNHALNRRVSALEAAVADIQRTLAALSPHQQVELSPVQMPLSTPIADEAIAPTTAPPAIPEIKPPSTPRVRVTVASEAGYDEPALPATSPPGKARPLQKPDTSQMRPLPRLIIQEQPQGPQTAQVERPPLSVTIIRIAEMWLNKVGIVIFLFGVAFLFKYSIDRGWLNEQARVGLGLLLGTVLLAFGLRLHGARRHFNQVLLGGSIATYYITGYAAYNIFPNLNVPYEVAFGFMSLVTLAAFALSVRQSEMVLSIIGVTGGLLTPLVLDRAEVRLPALVAYTCLLIAGASAIYMAKGWRSLLWSCVQGMWSILMIAYSDYIYPFGYPFSAFEPNLGDLWTLQAGAAFTLLAFWAVPVLREVLSARDPARWPTPIPTAAAFSHPDLQKLIGRHVHILTLAMPVMAFAYSADLWADLVPKQAWGAISIGGAALFLAAYWAVRRYAPALQSLAYTHAIIAVTLLTVGLTALLEGNTLLFALAAEGAALHLVARYASDRGIAICGNLIFSAVGAWLAWRLLHGASPILWPLTGSGDGPAVFNSHALTDLAAIVIILATSFVARGRNAALTMRSLAHLAVMAWLWREIHAFQDGAGYVMLAWATYLAAVALISHYLRDYVTLTRTGIGFLGVAYLFFARILTGHEGEMAMLNPKTLIDLGAIALALATSFVARPREAKIAYHLLLHIGILGLIWREFFYLDAGSNSLFSFLRGEYGYAMLGCALYLTALQVLAWRTRDEATSVFAHNSFVVIAGLLSWRLFTSPETTVAIFNGKALIDLAVITLAAAVSFIARPRKVGSFYRYGVHAAVLVLFVREFQWLSKGDGYVMLAWGAYAALLYLVSRLVKGLQRERMDLAAHALFATCGLWFLSRIITGLVLVNEDQLAVFNPKGLTDLGLIALGAAMYGMVRWLTIEPQMEARRDKIARAYALWLHFAFLGWTWQELGLIPNGGNGYVTIAWGIYAATLVAVGLRLNRNLTLLTAGVTTLFAVAAKLFLIDLQYVDAIWRILLFLGFGGFFLVFSYYFQGAIRAERTVDQT